MKIIFEKINEKLSYSYENLRNKNNTIELTTLADLNIIFANSYNPIKSIHGFEKMLIENDKKEKKDHQYFIDHSNYANLFLIFDSENNVLEYVQDLCEARGEKIPKNFANSLEYLIDENTYVMKIKEFDIDISEFKNYFKK